MRPGATSLGAITSSARAWFAPTAVDTQLITAHLHQGEATQEWALVARAPL